MLNEEISDDDIQVECDESELEDEVTEMQNENDFVVHTVTVADWTVVGFANKKTNKMYVGQLTEKSSCLKAKFCRRIGTTSTFHWPNVEDRSIIQPDEILKCLPPPVIDKRGKIKFDILFDSYNVG